MTPSPTETDPVAFRPAELIRRLLPIALVLVAAVVASVKMQERSRVPEGSPAPALSASFADGSLFQLEGADEVVVINFWATWCAPCRQEAPILSAVHRDGVRVVGMAIDDKPLDRLTRAARKIGMEYPVAAADTTMVNRFQVTMVPTTYVVAADGTIVFSRVGMVSQEDLDGALKSARDPG